MPNTLEQLQNNISNLEYDENFKKTEVILSKLKKNVLDTNSHEQVKILLNNLENLKNTESNELTTNIDTVYQQLLQLKTNEQLELSSEEIDTITTLTETLWGFKNELLELKNNIQPTTTNTGDKLPEPDNTPLDKESDDFYNQEDPLDNTFKKPLIQPPKWGDKELFTQKEAFKRWGRALIGLWWFLWIRRLRKKLKNRKEKQNTEKPNTEKPKENKETSKPKKKWFWRKVLKWTWIGWWLYTGYKFLKWDWSFKKLWDKLRGKDTWADVNEVIDNEKDAADSFEDLQKSNPDLAKKYSAVWNDVNIFSNDIYRFNDGSIDKTEEIVSLWASKDKYPGALPYVLDNSYENLQDMTSEISTFQLMAKWDSKSILKQLKTRITSWLDEKNFLVRMTLKILWYKNLKEFQNGGANSIDQNKVDEVNIVFQKILRLISYISFVKRAYILQKIKNTTIQKTTQEDSDWDPLWEKISSPSTPQEQSELIEDILAHPEKYRSQSDNWDYQNMETVVNNFKHKNIKDIAELHISNDDIKTANTDIYNKIKDINNDREKYRTQIENWWWTEVMNTLRDNCEEQLSDSLLKSFTRVMPLATLIELTGAGSEEQLKKQYLQKSWFKKLIQEYQKRFENSKDLSYEKQKKLVDKYLTLLKEMSTTQAWLQNNVNDDGSTIVTLTSTFFHLVWNTKQAFTTWFYFLQKAGDSFVNWHYLDASWNLAMWVLYGTWAVWVTLMWAWAVRKILSAWKRWGKMFSLGKSLSLAPITIPVNIAKKYAKTRTPQHILSWYLSPRLLKKFYKWDEALRYALKNGLPFSKAYDVYKFSKQDTQISKTDFFKKMFETIDDDAQKVLSKYLFNKDEPSEYANLIWRKFRRKFVYKQNIFKKTELLFSDKFLKQIKPLSDQIHDGKVLRQFASELSIKKLTTLSQMFTKNPEILKLLNTTKEEVSLKAITMEILYHHKISKIPELSTLKNIASWSKEVRKIAQLTESEKLLRAQIENSVKDLDQIIKRQSWATNMTDYIKQLTEHKKNLTKISEDLLTGKIDDDVARTIKSLISKTHGKYKIQINLFRELANEQSEIHTALKWLKNAEKMEESATTIKNILRLWKNDIQLWDEIVDLLKWLRRLEGFEKIFKYLRYAV